MSAYIVDKDHIRFLVNSALWVAAYDRSYAFTWYHEKQVRKLNSDNVDEIGQMLLDECGKSVSDRYPDLPLMDLPGPNDAHWLIPYSHNLEDEPVTEEPWVAQLFKSIDCYEYQSCEHPEWVHSSAKVFIEFLRIRATRMLPSYASAQWGAPKKKEFAR